MAGCRGSGGGRDLPRFGRTACAAGLLLAAAAQAELPSELEFCSAQDECELLPVSEHMPARLCPAAGELPQSWAWPFTQVRLRLVTLATSGEESSSWWGAGALSKGPSLRYTAPARGFCRWFGAAARGLCSECDDVPCRLAIGEAWGSNLTYEAFLPPYGGCVYVHRLPHGVTRARGTLQPHWDLSVLLRVAGGLLLLWNWRALRESTTLHASMGGVGSLVFLSSVVILWVAKEMRGTIQGAVPFGRSLTGLTMALCAFLPAARQALIGWIVPSSGPDWQAWLQVRDPWYDLPVGWIVASTLVVVALATVQLGASISMRYFASPPEPEGEVPFQIGADGRRLDVLPPPPWTQKVLGWIIWGAGLLLVLFSTHLDSVSLLLLLLVLFGDNATHLSRLRLLSLSSARPENFRPLMSLGKYNEQGRECTAEALVHLQQTLQTNPSLMRTVKEDSELRLRRFTDGGAHYQLPMEGGTEEGGRHCAVL